VGVDGGVDVGVRNAGDELDEVRDDDVGCLR